MSNDEEVGSSDGEDSLAEVGEDSSRVMMSIFESYYGIEDGEGDGGGGGSGNEAGPHRSSGDIDSVHFDPENFCRVLLQNAPLEEMLLRDTKMTHEIRALDSDMQMLVYENYNKFIAATETIKRMKSNVDAMDSDMEAVRVKMDGITSSSITLDESLDAKHGRVDKLVRVRRVLERLEFLSELPEKLESMILREEYQRAVRLYRRTIHVLTQHSQVLSFRKIKERTEAMMADLRGKVTDLLEDPGLDAVKLTQYASILRLMEADRRQVCQRLLQAHRQRSMRMLRHFSSSLTTKQEARGEAAAAAALADGIKLQPPKTPSSAPSPNVGNIGDDFSSGSSSDRARRFHQGLVVGLIEACRGLQELYGASPASLVHHRSQHNPSVTPLASRGRAASGDSIGSNSTAMATPGGSLLLSLPKEAPIPPEDIAQASAGFGSLLKEVVTSYRTSMIAAASDFFERYAAFFETHQALEAAVRDQGQGQGQGIGDSPAAQALRSSQLQLYVLEDERQAWILLARQAIADCEFCEREARKSMAELRGATPPAFSRDFSSAMLDALDVHLHQCLKRRALGFCAVLPQAEAEITALTSSFAHPGAASGGGAFPGKSVQVCRARCEALVEAVMQAQSDFCSDCKEVVDAYGSVDEAGVAAYVSGLAGAWGAGLAASCEMACGVASAALGIGAGIGSDDGDDGGMEWGSGASAPLHNTAGGLRNLLLYCVIGMLTGSPATVARMDKEWALLGLGLGLGLGPGQGRRAAGVSRRLQASGNRAFQAYVDHHARLFSDLSVGVIEAGRARDLTGSSVAPQCIELVLKLDRLAASASVVLGDGPTVFSKIDEYSARRASTQLGRAHASRVPGLGSGPGAGGANSQLQLNIDRLFAQRVSVFAPTPLPSEGLVLGGPALDAAASASAAIVGCRALDALLATVIKAALKAAIEATRSRSFWRTSQLFTDLAFLRRCAVALLPGGSASSTSGSASSSSSSSSSSGGAGGSSSAAAAVAAAAAAASSTARQDVESLHEQLVLSLQARGAQGQGAADAQALAVQEGIRRISDLHALVL